MSKLPCPCGSLVPAGQCCAAAIVRDLARAKKREVSATYILRGFPITVAQLRYADAKAVSRLKGFLGLTEVNHEELAMVLNEGVTAWKRAHIAVNKKRG
jgi:uncharacterized protein YchJ